MPDGNRRVARCADQSGNGNDASQPEASSRPVLVESRVNGHAVLEFSSNLSDKRDSYLRVSDHSSLRFATEDFAYVVVASWKNSAQRLPGYYGYGRIVSKQAVGSPYGGVALLANYPAGIDQAGPLSTRLAVQVDTHGTFALSNSMGLNNDRFRVCAARRMGDDLEVRINGVLEGKVRMQAGTDLSSPGADMLIGGFASEALDGDVAELVVIHEQMLPDDLAALERYLLEKYAL